MILLIAKVVGCLYLTAFFVYFVSNAQKGKLPLHPYRMLKVNQAFLQHITGMIIGPIIATYSRFLIRLPKFEKGIVFAQRSDGRKMELDVHTSSKDPNSKKPVIVFIYGGAWCTGSKDIYAPLAQSLMKAGYVVVVPNYVLYPKGLVEDMLDDVADALVWTTKNIKNYGGDPKNLHIMGHSAGGHLAALVLIHNFNTQTLNEFCLNTTGKNVQMRPLSVRIPKVLSATLLSGVYDIQQHFLFESGRKVEFISAMGRAMGNTETAFDLRSPKQLMRMTNAADLDAATIKRRNKAFDEYLPKHWLVLHGDNDTTVPHSQSTEFHQVLHNDLGITGAKLKIYSRIDHGTPILVPMSLDSDYTIDFFHELESLIEKSQNNQ